MQFFVLNFFLYFPEDKRDYIPAVLELLVILILCLTVFLVVLNISKKQERKAKELEQRILQKKGTTNTD